MSLGSMSMNHLSPILGLNPLTPLSLPLGLHDPHNPMFDEATPM
jgi:hypothetical protein